jgi:hypothetical protein
LQQKEDSEREASLSKTGELRKAPPLVVEDEEDDDAYNPADDR